MANDNVCALFSADRQIVFVVIPGNHNTLNFQS